MRYRLFAAINLSDKTKDELAKVADKWTELPVVWTEKENLHITLCFMGEVDEFSVAQIKRELTEAGKRSKPLPIFLTNISLGPSEFDPKMIWANGSMTDELRSLVKEIHEKVGQCECGVDKINDFKLHVTLAKVGNKMGRVDHIPPIREEINISFEVESFELMESKMGPKGSSYQVLETFSLK